MLVIKSADVDKYQKDSRKRFEYGYTFRIKPYSKEEHKPYSKEEHELHLFEKIKGGRDDVVISRKHRISGHSHPSYIYGDILYHPPTQTDYIESIYDFAEGNWWGIVFESKGTWIYRPRKILIKTLNNASEEFLDYLEDKIAILGQKISSNPPIISLQEYISSIRNLNFEVKYFSGVQDVKLPVNSKVIDPGDELLFYPVRKN